MTSITRSLRHPSPLAPASLIVGLLLGLALMLPRPGLAADGQQVFGKLSTAELQGIMQGEGYAVSIDEDGDLVWKLDGYRTFILVAKDNESIQFRAAFNDGNATLEKVNEWNRGKRYSTSYLDSEDDPVLELDLDLAGGVTRDRILDYLTTSRVSFAAWIKEVVN